MKQTTKKNKKRFKSYTFWTFCHDFIKFTGAIPAWIFFRPKIIRMGKKGKLNAAILMANHVGFFDPIILQFAFPLRRKWSLATKDFFNNALNRAFFKSFLCIPVDKKNVTIDMYHGISDVLKAGKLLLIFPEGTINASDDAEFMKFKGGVALFAILNKVPVVPIYIVKREKWYQRQRLVIGEPVYLDEALGRVPTPADIEKVSELLQTKEEELASNYKEKINAKSIKS